MAPAAYFKAKKTDVQRHFFAPKVMQQIEMRVSVSWVIPETAAGSAAFNW